MRRLADQALETIRQVPGAVDSGVEQEADQGQLRLTLDRDTIARYGLNISDVEGVIEMAVGGKTVSTMYQADRRFDISVRYSADARKDPGTIGNILVQAANGNTVPLSQLADIRVVNGRA